jgi:glycosyltransferase involved in cell wall biosynthesis
MRISLIMIGSGTGGVQQTVVPYCDALSRMGHELQVVLYRKSPLVSEIRALGIEPEFVRFPCQRKLVTTFLSGVLKQTIERFGPDIVIGFAARGYPEARRALGHTVPIITRVASLKEKAIAKLMGADGYLVTTEFMKALLVRRGIDPLVVRVIPNFLRRPLFPVERQKFRTPPVIGTLGRIMQDKGFDTLLDALAFLKAQHVDFRAIIGGDGEDMSALREQAQRLGLAGLVEFPGWVSNDQKAQFLSKLDVFVCPSRYEPFGIVMLEAMEAGLPLIASRTTGSEEIIDDGRTGIIVPNEDPAGMAEALGHLINNPQKARHLASAATENLKKRFHVSSAGTLLGSHVADLHSIWVSSMRSKNG